MSSKNKTKQQKLRSLSRLKKVLIFFEALFAVCVILMGTVMFVPAVKGAIVEGLTKTPVGQNIIKLFGSKSYDKSVFDGDFNKNQVETNNLQYNYSEEYTNFILFGIDSRTSQFDEGTNSDSMVIVSVHNTTGEVKMVSIYRDTFLRIYNSDGTYKYFKVNSAYSVGGAEGAINTLNKNLDLQLTDYVTVNFAGVAKIIDTLGGIKVNLTDDEVNQLNHHMKSTISTTGEYAKPIAKSGKNIKLNGIQATTYCRIRKATFYDPDTGKAIRDDFGRAARQRSVIMKLVDRAKKASVSELQQMINTVLDGNTKKEKIISTSFDFDQIVGMLPIIFDFSLSGSEGFPSELTTGTIDNTSYVLPQGLSQNVTALHEFLYGEENYQPTSTVEEIDSSIVSQTVVSSSSTGYNPTEMGETSTDEEESHPEEYYDYDDGGDTEFH